jgi:hypothetical protein
MKKIIYLLFFLCLVLSGCDNDDDFSRDNVTFFQQNLSRDMTLREVKATFGEPDADVGSGIHIFHYKLEDSTTVIIGVTDVIMYARHVDSNGNVLSEMI